MAKKVQCRMGEKDSCPYMGNSCNLKSYLCSSGDIRIAEGIWGISQFISPNSKIWVHEERFYVCEPEKFTKPYYEMKKEELKKKTKRAIGNARISLNETINKIFN